ncbi:MAG: helix-turn-helix transcriptional regulator [Planctomycetaceae bacterium]
MKISIDTGERRFLERLSQLGEGTIQSIGETLGVTATAVRHRLARLQSLDLIERETVRTGRGRPHHVYRVTDAGRRLLGENYGDLAMILWRELRNIEDPSVRGRVFKRVEDALVSQYGETVVGEDFKKRLNDLGVSLAERGFDVEVETHGALPVLRENNCPYLGLASEHPEICELEQAVFTRVLGTPMRLTQCCLDGHSCCEFEPADYDAEAVGSRD